MVTLAGGHAGQETFGQVKLGRVRRPAHNRVPPALENMVHRETRVE